VVLEGGHSIPLLKTVLDQLAGKAALNIELKGPNTAAPVASLLKSYLSDGTWEEEGLLISSFDWALLFETRKLLPKISIGVLTEGPPLEAIPVAKQLSAVAINPYYKDLDATIVAQIHAAGFKVYTWTVNTPEDLKNTKTLGVDAVLPTILTVLFNGRRGHYRRGCSGVLCGHSDRIAEPYFANCPF